MQIVTITIAIHIVVVIPTESKIVSLGAVLGLVDTTVFDDFCVSDDFI